MTTLALALVAPLLLAPAHAADPGQQGYEGVVPAPPSAAGGLRFLGVYQARSVTSNVLTTSPFLDGQVIGLLGGLNGTAVGKGTEEEPQRTRNTEQRVNGFFTYAPKILDGKAALNAAWEVDFAFGDQAYQTAGNTGGGFGADQINLQTRRMNASYDATLPTARTGNSHTLTFVLGQQFVADGVYDPAKARPDDLFRAGAGLMYWGSEAAGLSAYGKLLDEGGERLRYRLGGYTLWEKGASLPDDATLWMADLQYHPAYASRLGVHAYVLQDDTGGSGGIGGLGTGPTSILSELQGGPVLSLSEDGTPVEVDSTLAWVGIDGGYNHRLDRGPVGVEGAIFANVGRLYVTDQEDINVRGWSANGEARWRYARGEGSVLRAGALVTSKDDPGGDYGGVITGNAYGVAGALWASSGMVLLFSDRTAINRQASLVYDVSNQGRGLVAGVGGVAYDLVPGKLNAQVQAGQAREMGGASMGTEVNARLGYKPFLYSELALTGAQVSGGRVVNIEDPTGALLALDDRPWAVNLTFDWVVF